jgi:hypothetical protein
MDIDFVAHVEQTLDNLRRRVEALETAAVQTPGLEMETDPSRLPVVRPAPAPAPAPKGEA